MVGIMTAWVWQLEAVQTCQRMSLMTIDHLRDRYKVPSDIYSEVFRDLREGLRGATKLRNRPVLGVWERLLEMQMEGMFSRWCSLRGSSWGIYAARWGLLLFVSGGPGGGEALLSAQCGPLLGPLGCSYRSGSLAASLAGSTLTLDCSLLHRSLSSLVTWVTLSVPTGPRLSGWWHV